MKLFLVKCKGMTINPTGAPHGKAYVLADDPTSAYNKLKAYLDDKNLGFADERVLDRITLVAEEGDYPKCRIQLIR